MNEEIIKIFKKYIKEQDLSNQLSIDINFDTIFYVKIISDCNSILFEKIKEDLMEICSKREWYTLNNIKYYSSNIQTVLYNSNDEKLELLVRADYLESLKERKVQ